MHVLHRDPIRLVIVEREELGRDLLRIALSNATGLEVLAVYGDGRSALDAAAELRPQVAVLDLELTNPNAVQLAFKLRRMLPEIGVVLLSSAHDVEMLSSIPDNLLFGWSYIVNRSAHTVTTLGRAVQVTAARLLELQAPSLVAPDPRHDVTELSDKLTDRQLEILELVARGLSNAAIAQIIEVKEKTVENQLASVYERLEIRRERNAFHPRVRAVLRYLQVATR